MHCGPFPHAIIEASLNAAQIERTTLPVNRKLIAILALLTLLVPLLAACGGSTAEPTLGTSNEATTAPAGETAPATGGEETAAGGVETAAPVVTVGAIETVAPVETAGAVETVAPVETVGAIETVAPVETVGAVETVAPVETAPPAETADIGAGETAVPVETAGAVETAPVDETASAGETAPPGGATGDKNITIGSKDFTEQVILGELYSQALEAGGYTVNRRLNLGSVQVLDQALAGGQIDMYPEYTGTSLENVVQYEGEPPATPQETYDIVQEFYGQRNPPMRLLESADFNNTNAIVVRREVAEQYNLRTLEDLAKASPNLVFASFSEFQQRRDSFPNLKENYPAFNFKSVQIVNDIGLRYQALGQEDADVGIGFTTDGQIAALDLMVMEDPKNIWPAYYPTPILTEEYIQAHPDAVEIINSVSAALTAEAMQEMNAAVDIDEEEPTDVAAAFLQEQGLIE